MTVVIVEWCNSVRSNFCTICNAMLKNGGVKSLTFGEGRDLKFGRLFLETRRDFQKSKLFPICEQLQVHFASIVVMKAIMQSLMLSNCVREIYWHSRGCAQTEKCNIRAQLSLSNEIWGHKIRYFHHVFRHSAAVHNCCVIYTAAVLCTQLLDCEHSCCVQKIDFWWFCIFWHITWFLWNFVNYHFVNYHAISEFFYLKVMKFTNIYI